MTKLLIVDDDHFIRDGIKSLIDWDELGIDIVGTAEGGHEALKLAEALHPHIILTDIRMPRGDGLELIERIRLRDWNTQIVVLSGYNDYTYVRQAMKHQVEDYLLKPVDADELREIMKSCSERIRDQWLEVQLKRESFQLLRNNVLLRWMDNRIHADQLREKLQFLGIELLQTDMFQAAVITWHDWNEGDIPAAERQFRSFAILNSMEEALGEAGKGIAYVNQDRHVVCLMMGKSSPRYGPDLFAKDNLYWLRDISVSYAQQLKTPWFCTLGAVFPQPQSAHLSYRNALRLQDYVNLTAEPLCVDESCIAPRPDDESAPDAADREAIVNALLTGNRAVWLEALGNDFAWAAGQADPLAAVKYTAALWIVLMKQAVKQNRLSLQQWMPETRALAGIMAKQTVSDIHRCLLQLLEELEKSLLSAAAKPYNPIVEQVEDYIREHYAEELSLQFIATQFNVNAKYLGRLFKEETSQYFSDYLNRLRLAQAKLLLETTHATASEIAIRVGFPDSNYFFRKFKMTLGLSPTDYRNRKR